jgi:hypothetical protein
LTYGDEFGDSNSRTLFESFSVKSIEGDCAPLASA